MNRLVLSRCFGVLSVVSALSLGLLTGCGIGTGSDALAPAAAGAQPNAMGGVLHGGPNPIIGATVSLYTTSAGYGAAATLVATTSTDSAGSFNLTLPTTSNACPSGSFAYVTAYKGSTGSLSNSNSLLMVPVGLCDSNYTASSVTVGSVTTYTNAYTGPSLFLNELTSIASAYALGNFMTVTDAGVVNIGAPVNNTGTASATTPSASGLAHAFTNALALVNNHTGQPNGWTHGGTSNSTGGIIAVAEIDLLGNILQACVNSNGTTGTNTATANDGSLCGKLFSLTTPPVAGSAVPTNTMQAMLDLAKFPNPTLNTWDPTCTTTGSATPTTATTCLFNLAASSGAYTGALTAPPPDWALAVVYGSGYGANTTASGCTVAGTCPGLVYPYYIALDYADNVYVLNYSASTTTYTNIIGVGFDGTPIFSSPKDTTNLLIKSIGTDGAGHVFGVNNGSGTLDNVNVYSASTGSVLTTVTTGLGTASVVGIADPFNNIYVASSNAGVNLRKLTYNGNAAAPGYTAAAITTTAASLPILQMAWTANGDLYQFGGSSTAPAAFLLPNTGTVAAPTYPGAATSAAITGTTTNAYGMGATSAGNAFAISSNGLYPITKSGTGSGSTLLAGSVISFPTVITGYYSRYLSVDGNNTVVSPDGANGSTVTGVSVYDSTDSLALGTYKGCYVTAKTCGTSAGVAPMYSPRAAAIDSAGDIWVVSGASANLTELIGAAGPTWPGLSLAKTGRPQ